MSNKPWSRKAPKLWLPQPELLTGEGLQTPVSFGATPELSDAHPSAPLQLTAGLPDGGGAAEGDEEDELDRLTSFYASEAAASSQQVQQRQRQQAQSQKGMAELRKEGLSTPLEANNK